MNSKFEGKKAKISGRFGRVNLLLSTCTLTMKGIWKQQERHQLTGWNPD